MVRVSAIRSSRSSRPRTAVPSSQWASKPGSLSRIRTALRCNGSRLPREPGCRVREDVALHLQLPNFTTQSCQFLPLGRGQSVMTHTRVTIGLRYPAVDGLRGRLELFLQLLRSATSLHQLDYLRPEFRRVRRTMLAHNRHLLIKR